MMPSPAARPVARKGYSRRADIPPGLLARLNDGTEPTATLTEGLAVDFAALLAAVVPELAGEAAASLHPSDGICRRMATAGALLWTHLGETAYGRLHDNPADTVRGWAAFAIAAMPEAAMGKRLRLLRPLADDPHFGVREWAWMALRPQVAANLPLAIRLLTAWTAEPSPFLRRFASECTRPRGVWCTHLLELKQNPSLALRVLDPLRADPARYVQDSVGNWLNDAAKSRPDWVHAVCTRWLQESPAPETQRICRLALRTR